MHQDAQENKKKITNFDIICTNVITKQICLWYPWKLTTDPQVSAEDRMNTTALGNQHREWYMVTMKKMTIQVTNAFQ